MHDRLTQRDIEKIQEEIDHRKLVVRPQILKEVQEARAQGDLSENFEYHAARKAKGENDSRIRYLENMIRTAVIVEDRSAEGQVGLEKKVTIRFLDEDEEETYKIVTSVRGSSLNNLITPESPLGRALNGHYAGDTVHVEVASGSGYDVKILSVVRADDEEESIRRF